MTKKIIITFLLFIIIVNIPLINKSVLSSIDGDSYYRYSNIDGSITLMQGFGFKDGYIVPDVTKSALNSGIITAEQAKLYRLYKINLLCFWRWSFYYFTSRQFEHKNWQDIAPNRVPQKLDSRYQEF